MGLFRNNEYVKNKPLLGVDFSFVEESDLYFDSACQTIRPQQVIETMQTYYHEYNACGGRVKYQWGRKVDEEIENARKNLLKYLGKSDREYICAFTLNTTYGLNLLLAQLPSGKYNQIITSDIEHNSVFLPTITAAKRLGINRRVLSRSQDGSLEYEKDNLNKAVVVLNSTSNIDGRNLLNSKDIADDVHKTGGILILDGAQSLAHEPEILKGIDYDAICFSGHKMYGPSIGVIVAKKDLVQDLDIGLIGGGTVQDVQEDSYTLVRGDEASHLELGLQDFAGIIGLNEALNWMQSYRPEGKPARAQQEYIAKLLYEGINDTPSLTVLNNAPSSILSFYSDKIDSHRLAVFLSEQGIMARSGYFCCHYYLNAKLKLPPLLRLSIGLNNTEDEVNKLINTIKLIVDRVK